MDVLTHIGLPLLVGAITSLALSLLVVFITRWHCDFSLDESHGVQKLHAHPARRIGGLPMLVGLLGGLTTRSANSRSVDRKF
jgi:hypothetical protein